MNTSITSDPYYHIPLDQHNYELRNNYAPIKKQLTDSIRSRDPHPLATYLEDRPFYNNVIYTETTARQIMEARKKRFKLPELDMVRLNSNSNKFESDVITGIDPLEVKPLRVGMEAFEVASVGIKKGGARFITATKESYAPREDDTYQDQIYIQSLESRIIAVLRYVKKNKAYAAWLANWNALESSMSRANYSFSRLSADDKDIAYTVDKGKETKFRIRGNNNRYVPINVYQYVLLHEAAHCANFDNWGHGPEFQDLLSLLSLASFELGFIRIGAINHSMYTTNGQAILSRGDIKHEILHGIELVKSKNPDRVKFYDELAAYVSRQ